ncbi:hypothetical protein DFH09DRAFT_1362394 [Mycena vulgaris]|nr:hypothetical protein DFH09DRAFT_1362394 [Mycena vulgaris]
MLSPPHCIFAKLRREYPAAGGLAPCPSTLYPSRRRCPPLHGSPSGINCASATHGTSSETGGTSLRRQTARPHTPRALLRAPNLGAERPFAVDVLPRARPPVLDGGEGKGEEWEYIPDDILPAPMGRVNCAVTEDARISREQLQLLHRPHCEHEQCDRYEHPAHLHQYEQREQHKQYEHREHHDAFAYTELKGRDSPAYECLALLPRAVSSSYLFRIGASISAHVVLKRGCSTVHLRRPHPRQRRSQLPRPATLQRTLSFVRSTPSEGRATRPDDGREAGARIRGTPSLSIRDIAHPLSSGPHLFTFLTHGKPQATLDTDSASSSAPQQPASLPNKAPKRSHYDLPRDQPHGERPSPQKRYQGKNRARAASPTPPHPLVGDTHEDDDDPNIEELDFFNLSIPNPPRVPTPNYPGHHSTERPPRPPHHLRALSRHPRPVPRLPTPTTTILWTTAVPDEVFKAPTRDEFIAALPKSRDKNPHRPSTAHDPEGEAHAQYAGFQANGPLWDSAVIATHVALDNMSDDITMAVRLHPENFLSATVFSGGHALFEKHKNVRADVARALEEIAGGDKLTVIMPQAKVVPKQARRAPGGKSNKFVGPIELLIRCSDVETRNKLTTQATFAVDHLLAFHVTSLDAERLSWAVAFFKTDISNTPKVTGGRLRWAAYDRLARSSPAPKAANLIDRATQGGSALSREQRLHDFAATFDVRHLPHADNPVYVLYAKPCTKDAALWDEIRANMRITVTDLLEAFIPHVNASTGHNLCADCKLDCHPKYNCMFTVRDRGWWGPKGLEAILKLLRGGESESEGEARGEPRPRTSNWAISRGRGQYNRR